MKKGIRLISDVILGLLFIAAVSAVVLYVFGVRPAVIMSGSMEPNIHTGSISFVNTKAEYGSVEEGDVIVFQLENGTMVAHRAVTITDVGIETKGDANDVSDGITTTPDNFKGKNLFSIPYVGYAAVYLQQPVCMVIVIVIIIGIILFNLVDTVMDRREKKQAES